MRAKLNAKNKTINSGYCSGKNLEEVLEHSKNEVGEKACSSSAVQGHKGTVRSFSAQTGGKDVVDIPETLDCGGFAGNSTDGLGTVDDKKRSRAAFEGSMVVVGTTLQSFNAEIPSEAVISEEAFTPGIPEGNRQIATLNLDDELLGKKYGTHLSFRVRGKGSVINCRGMVANTGYGAGNSDAVTVALKDTIVRNKSYKCRGTEKSFCADSGGQINTEGSKLNAGAFSGITEAPRRKRKSNTK